MSRVYSQPIVGRLRTGLFAIIGALCLLCITVTVTFANTVNIYDNAGVLNQSQVRSEASSLSYPIAIYTTNSFGGSTSSFDQTAVSKISNSNLIVIAIDTVHHHLAIVGGRSVSLSNSQYTDARNAFSSNFHSNDYTTATVAAVRSLHDASSGGLSVPGLGSSSGGGIGFGTLCCIGLLVLAALAGFGVIRGRRRGSGFFNQGFNRGPIAPPYNPNYNQYNQPYPPNYGPGYPGYNQNQGMNPLAAGGLGAAAGGLLGYELGKEQGEREGDQGGDGGGFGGGSSGDFGGGNNDGGGFGGGSSGDFGGGGGDSGGGSSGDFGGGDSGGGSSGSF
jgi:hypothetical protein